MMNWFASFPLLVLAYTVSSEVRLLPDPDPLDGTTICSVQNITLQCLADNFTGDAIRWFINGDKLYAVKSIPVNNEIFLPIVLLPVEKFQNISGLVVMLNRLSSSGGKYYFESILTVITSTFNHSELLTFKCGSFAEQSNPVSLNFSIKIPDNPIPDRLMPIYDDFYQLTSVTVNWRQPTLSTNEDCSGTFIYNVLLINNSEDVIKEESIFFADCSNFECSTNIELETSHINSENYTIGIRSGDIYGHFNEELLNFSSTINGSIQNSFSSSFEIETCMALFLCSSHTLNVSECEIQYGQDPSYTDLSSSVYGPLNELFHLGSTKVSTLYYFQISLNLSASLVIQQRGTFTTYSSNNTTILAPDHLTSSNFGLLVIGVLLLSVTILSLVPLLFYRRKSTFEQPALKIILLTGALLILLSVVLWIAVGLHVGLEDDTCDSRWQFTRNSLIISAFIFSLIVFLMVLVIWCIKLSKDKFSKQEQDNSTSHDRIYNMETNEVCKPENFYGVDEASNQGAACGFYMKTNQVYTPENFDGVSESLNQGAACGFYMKTNQVYTPENFDGVGEVSNQENNENADRPESKLYDLPEEKKKAIHAYNVLEIDFPKNKLCDSPEEEEIKKEVLFYDLPHGGVEKFYANPKRKEQISDGPEDEKNETGELCYDLLKEEENMTDRSHDLPQDEQNQPDLSDDHCQKEPDKIDILTQDGKQNGRSPKKLIPLDQIEEVYDIAGGEPASGKKLLDEYKHDYANIEEPDKIDELDNSPKANRKDSKKWLYDSSLHDQGGQVHSKKLLTEHQNDYANMKEEPTLLEEPTAPEEHRYINQIESILTARRTNKKAKESKPPNYINQEMEKREWPYGFIA